MFYSVIEAACTPNNCKHGGRCDIYDDMDDCITKYGEKCLGYTCTCLPGYFGAHCEKVWVVGKYYLLVLS